MKSNKLIALTVAILLLPSLSITVTAQQANQPPASASTPPTTVTPAQTPNPTPAATADSANIDSAIAELNALAAQTAQKRLAREQMDQELEKSRNRLEQLLQGMKQNTKIYKWVDANGNTQYGKTKPAGIDAQLLNADPAQMTYQQEPSNRQIYKWTDPSGKVRYGEIPPNGIATQALKVYIGPSTSGQNSMDLASRFNALADDMARERTGYRPARPLTWEERHRQENEQRAQALARQQDEINRQEEDLNRQEEDLNRRAQEIREQEWKRGHKHHHWHWPRTDDKWPRPIDVHARPDIDVHARPDIDVHARPDIDVHARP